MTKTAEAGELAAHLIKFLDEVGAGHEVIVTRDRQPVARLVPAPPEPGTEPRRRSVLGLPTLPGRWIGEPVIRGADLAEEMLDRG